MPHAAQDAQVALAVLDAVVAPVAVDRVLRLAMDAVVVKDAMDVGRIVHQTAADALDCAEVHAPRRALVAQDVEQDAHQRAEEHVAVHATGLLEAAKTVAAAHHVLELAKDAPVVPAVAHPAVVLAALADVADAADAEVVQVVAIAEHHALAVAVAQDAVDHVQQAVQDALDAVDHAQEDVAMPARPVV